MKTCGKTQVDALFNSLYLLVGLFSEGSVHLGQRIGRLQPETANVQQGLCRGKLLKHFVCSPDV
jgi:hypothetical protein